MQDINLALASTIFQQKNMVCNTDKVKIKHDVDKCRKLLEAGADPNVAVTITGIPALIFLTAMCDYRDTKDFCKLLVEYGADINARDNYYQTALHYIKNSIYSPQSQNNKFCLELKSISLNKQITVNADKSVEEENKFQWEI